MSEPFPDPAVPPPSRDPPDPVRLGEELAAAWSPSAAIAYGWNTCKSRFDVVGILLLGGVLANAVSFVGSMISGLMQASGGKDAAEVGQYVEWILTIVNLPISIYFAMTMTRYVLRVVRREPCGVGDLFSGGPYGWFFFGWLIVAFATMVGLLFLIVPGIVIAIGWSLWNYLVVDGTTDPIDAVKRSWRLTKGHRWAILGLGLLAFLVNLVGLLACCVGAIFTSAVTSVAFAWTYECLRLAAPPEPPAE
jgi:hypothetical protein